MSPQRPIGDDPLSEAHAWFNTLEPAWWTVGLTLRRGPEWVTMGRVKWTIFASVMVTRWGYTRNSRVRYMSHIQASPWNAAPQELRALTRAGIFDRVARQVRSLGFRGEWHKTRGDRIGLFTKTLRDLAAVRAEVARLEAVSFATLLERPSNKRMQLTRSAMANGRRGPRS